MAQHLFNLLVCGFEFYISYMLFGHFMQKKTLPKPIKLSFLLLLTVLLFLINIMAKSFIINSTATIALVLCMAIVLFDGHVGKKLFLSLATSGIAVLSELATGFAASGFFGNTFIQFMAMPGHVMFFTIVSKLAQFFTIQTIILFVGKERYGADRRESLYLLLCPVLAILNMYVLLYLDLERQTHIVEHSAIFVLGVGWLAMSVILLKVYQSACERHELRHRLTIMEIQKQAENEYLQRQKMNEQTVRQIMHDIRNQLINVQNVMTTDSQQGVCYLKQCISSLQDGPSMQITTDYNNMVLNQILNKNKATCEHLGIELKMQIAYDQLGFLNVMDTSAIFDNAFDNAIYACNEMPKEAKRYILFKVAKSGDMVNITMRNTKPNSPVQRDGKWLSTKAEGANHGFGLASIKSAVARYDGVVIVNEDEQEFILTASLNMNKM